MDEATLSQQRFATHRADLTRRRLRAIEGQTRGLVRMIDEHRPCLDVLVQMAAVQEALSQVNKLVMRSLLEDYARLAEQAASPEEEAIVYDDLMDTIYKYRR
jgi:CsoR family transcriptional regulator, copper-sensing transcriptional repressor